MTIEAETLKVLVQQLNESGGDKVISNLAAWVNRDANGKFLNVEISPRYAKKQAPPSSWNTLEQLLSSEELRLRNWPCPHYFPINIFEDDNRRSHSGRRKLEKKHHQVPTVEP